MEIQVQKGEGITMAIKRTLKEKEGATNSNFRGSVWNKILDLVDQQNEENKAKGEKALYQGGNDRGNDYRNNYKVFVGQILKFSANIWNQIKAVVGLTGANPTQPTEPTAPAQPTNPAQPADPAEPAAPADPAQKTTADDIKVTVPMPEEPTNGEEVKNIEKNKQEGYEIAAIIKKAIAKCGSLANMAEVDNAEAALKKITKDNVIYVLEAYPNLVQDIDNVDALGYGFDKDEILAYVMQPLAKKLGKDDAWVNKNMQGSIEEIFSLVKSEAAAARGKEDSIVRTYNKEKAEYDKAQKAQECFDKATALLEEVGNMSEKPEVVKDGNSAKITLFDGRFIKVDYDANGEIVAISISHDINVDADGTDHAEVRFDKNSAAYNYDKTNYGWEGSMTSGYNFEALKSFVEQILNSNANATGGAKPTAPTQPAEPTVPTEPTQKATADDIKVKVPQVEDIVAKNRENGKKVAQEIKEAFSKCTFPFTPADVDNAEAALKKITKDNVAYVLEAYPTLIQDIDNIDYFGYGFDKDEIAKYVIVPLLKRLGESAEWFGQVMQKSVEEISKIANGKIEAAKQKEQEEIKNKQEEVKKAQECFDKANELLVKVANMDPRPAVVKNEKSAKITLEDGTYISVDFNSDGEIERIGISYDTTKSVNGKDTCEVAYQKDKAQYDYDKTDGYWDGSIKSGYDFEKLKALAEQIFS